MKVLKTRIYPTKNQIRYFQRCFGLRRWYWNWGLETYMNELNTNSKYMSGYDLCKKLNNEVLCLPEYQWARQCHCTIRQQVMAELNTSWRKYYKAQKEARKTLSDINDHCHKPNYLSKKKSTKSFTQKNSGKETTFKRIDGKYFKLPMYGKNPRSIKPMSLKLSENINWLKDDDISIKQVTIKQIADRYYIYFVYERTNHSVTKPDENTKIGIDMGMKTPLTCWDGTKEYKFNPLDRIKKAEKHRERCNKRLCKKLDSYKKQQGYKSYNKGFKFTESKRYKKIIVQLQRAYQREEHIKQDFREQVTTWLVRNYHIINIEPFTNGFKKSRRALSRVSQYAFYERLQEKALEYSTDIYWISWEPTTQTCSQCGHRFEGDNKLTMKDRVYKCPICGNVEDRDVNAAKNIYKMKPEEM